MRISDEERREKRENLRHTVNDTLGSLSLQQRLAAITMTEHGSWLGAMRGLADLVDRPTTHNSISGAPRTQESTMTNPRSYSAAWSSSWRMITA